MRRCSQVTFRAHPLLEYANRMHTHPGVRALSTTPTMHLATYSTQRLSAMLLAQVQLDEERSLARHEEF